MTGYFTLQDMPQHTVIATALSATCLTNLSASVLHIRSGNLIGNLLPTLVIAASAGIAMNCSAQYIALDMSPDCLRQLLAGAIGLSAATMLYKAI
jgi:uncharacterized membrane protein YfcA